MEGGEQTKLTGEIGRIVRENKFGNDLESVLEILEWIKDKIRSVRNPEVFRRRTAADIVNDGWATGCTDFTLAFLVLARAAGIKAWYVELLSREWLAKGGDPIVGHVIAEIEIKGKRYYVDATNLNIGLRHTSGMVIVDKGLDSWDIGIRNRQDLRKKFDEFRDEMVRRE